MKRKTRSLIALFLILSALLSVTVPVCAYSDALGEELSRTDTDIHQNTALSTNVFWSSYFSNFRTENFITYKPNGAVRPLITYGDALTDVSAMTPAVRYLERNGYRVVCGINGDFFNTRNGLPVGLVVTDGILRTSDAGYYALGFRSDGSAIIGKPALKVHADFGYKIYEESGYGTQVVRDIAAVNKARVSTGGIYLFTRDFSASHSTGNTEAGIDAVCDVISGSLKIGGTVKMRVREVVETSKPTPIAANQIVLSVNLKSDPYWQRAFRNLPIGSEITVTVTAEDTRWNDVQQAIGALYLLAENGRVVTKSQDSRGPRTAVGLKNDGTLIFYTIDGRLSGHSIGATLYQTAERLLELGCSTVLGMDGGGSTTIAVTMPDSKSAATINRPSEGSERAVTNKIFLVSTEKATGVLDHFYLRPDNAMVLAGSKVRLSVSGVDTAYFPMDADYKLTASAGSVEGAVVTTPSGGGAVTVTASGGGKKGSTVIEAVASPDSLTVRDSGGKTVTELKLDPGASVQLSASASYRHLKLYAENSAFTWSNASRFGQITPSGLYTAKTPGEDTITVACAGRSLSIPVTVSKTPLVEMDDFEDAPAGVGSGAAMVSAVGGEYARYGRGAGEFHYDLSGQTPSAGEGNATRMPSGNDFAELSGFNEPIPEETPAAPEVYGEDTARVTNGERPEWDTPIEESGPDMGAGTREVERIEGQETGNPAFGSAIAPDDNGETTTPAVPTPIPDASLSGTLSPNGAQWRYSRPLSMPGIPYDTVSIWVKGDSSGNRFSLLCRDNSGAEIRVPVAALDFSEWRRILVPLGSTSYAIAGFAVNAPTGTVDDEILEETPRTGVIYLDQMVATYNDTADNGPPVVTITRNENIIRATVKDEGDGILPRNAVYASVNGVGAASSYDASKGVMIVTLPEFGESQEPTRVTVTARDASGNIGRASVDIAPYNVTNKFNDIEGCWAADYINFLYNRGIAEPYADGSYRPYEVITRAEFAVMLARATNLDGRLYADIQLPYADLDQIPVSALPALKALYAENIMRGAEGPDGRLYLMPNSGLTRAHASAMIGRSQKLGYGSADLPFPDADSIPAYAVPHIRVMVARGILEGYADGYFHSGNNMSRGQMAKILYFLA